MAKKAKRNKIKYRNAVTELWNDGNSMASIAAQTGLSEKHVFELLDSARKGYNTLADLYQAKGL